MKNILLMTALAFALVAAVPARAQGTGGCDQSPENPTLVLAGLASGVVGVSNLRTRLRARRALKK